MDLAWAQKLVTDGAIVMHLPSMVIGRATRVIDGSTTPIVSPVNDRPLHEPVLEIDPGHTFLAVIDNFVVLGKRESRYFEIVSVVAADMVREMVRYGATMPLESNLVAKVLASALRSHAAIIEAAERQRTGVSNG